MERSNTHGGMDHVLYANATRDGVHSLAQDDMVATLMDGQGAFKGEVPRVISALNGMVDPQSTDPIVQRQNLLGKLQVR